MSGAKEQIYRDSAFMFCEAIRIAKAKNDGRQHEVIVILSEYHDGVFGRFNWLSALVDDTRILGGKLGVGIQTRLHECIVFSPAKEVAE